MSTVVAKLTCGNDDKWYYTEGSVSEQVSEVKCSKFSMEVNDLNALL